jgi:hypothetical protein
MRVQLAVIACAVAPLVAAQDLEEESAGTGDARATIARALAAMGGPDAARAVRAAALSVQTAAEAPRERHTLVLAGRQLHQASRGQDGVGFDVTLARDQAFLCDRGPDGTVSFLEDLAIEDAREVAYERDLLWMPLLLAQLADDPAAALEHKGKNSAGEEVLKATITPAPGNPGALPFVVRLRFAADTGLLAGAMGVIPCGSDAGKKRWLSYRDPQRVGALTLPHLLVDQRGEGEAAREVPVGWELDPQVDAALFARPKLEAE